MAMFPVHFRVICSSSVINVMGILVGIPLNLWIALDSMDILIILILTVHEYGIYFHLPVSSSIYFINVL